MNRCACCLLVLSFAGIAPVILPHPLLADEQDLAAPSQSETLNWSSFARELVLNLIPRTTGMIVTGTKPRRCSPACGSKPKTAGFVLSRERNGSITVSGAGSPCRCSIRRRLSSLSFETSARNRWGRPASTCSSRFARGVKSICPVGLGGEGIQWRRRERRDGAGPLDCSFRIDSTIPEDSILPVFVLKPEFHDLDLKLTDVDTRRIGLLGGWVAEELGNGTRKSFEDLLQSQEKPLLERLRKSLAKKQDRLRLDPADVGKLLPGN